MTARKKASLELERAARAEDFDQQVEYFDEDNIQPRSERRQGDFSGSKLGWLVDDFHGVTESVYEAVMVAAHRARQVGRRQKREIDNYNSSQVLTPESIEMEETSEKGIDHFEHIKPTVHAMDELMRKNIDYYYLEDHKKEKNS
jgi:DNA-directed RNA polymerase subunit K/omega